MPLKVEKRYNIQSKYKRQAYMELYKWISLKKEGISSELTLSNNSLRVVMEK